MKILHLTLKKKWYDMNLSGEKIEEYRELKQYWVDRLIEDKPAVESVMFELEHNMTPLCDYFDAVKFTNGYGKHRPSFMIECNGITIGCGMMTWGAPKDKEVFIIKLGRIILTDLQGEPIGFVEK